MGLKNLKVSYKINIISLITIILLGIVTFVLYNGMSKINNSFENSSSISNLALTITKTSEQGLQVSNALRGIIVNPDDTKAKENFIQAVKELDDLMLVLKDSTKKFQDFEKFEIAPLYDSQSKVLNKIIEKIKNGEALTKEDNTLSTKEWRPLKAALLKWQERNIERNKEIKEELNKTVSSVTTFILIILLITILSILVAIQLITRNIVSSLNIFQNGLLSFFAFSNKESSNVQLINLDGNDEFGIMAKVVNENIKKSNEILLNEEQVLEQIEKMIQNIERGFFMYRIKLKCENQQIETIRNNINSLANNLQMKISSISNVLLDFGESHFESRVPEDLDMVGTYGSLKSSTSLVGNNASELLAMILTTGDKLNEEITILSASSQNLSINANEAASSLEETAASLEEITSNIRNNTQSIAKMSALSFNVTKSVKEGEELANQTTTAMDEINTQVNLVNEAISVIDNIAFQTNILSLNAAVEAATAGEAGKGFAVVAQEVRNLASRSAEAAKEIKDIVELATKKANEGKEIANSMLEGYKDLNSNVSQTVTLISDIEMASKEQLLGIEQINDAVNNLDAQTQQNAMVSNQINDLSREVSELSSKLVSAANLADYSKKTKDYICNVDLVFKTAKLKNDHIRFKENNFAKLGNNERWTVVSCNDCNLGKWIKESEQNQEKYTKTQSWNKLKDYHADIHNSVQKYIDEDVEVNSKVNLKDLAIDIEILTSHIFDELNMVKKNVCLEKPEIS